MHDWRPQLRAAFAGYRRSGVREVEYLCADQACGACRRLDAHRFPLDEAPRLPLERCSHDVCRCTYVAIPPPAETLIGQRGNLS